MSRGKMTALMVTVGTVMALFLGLPSRSGAAAEAKYLGPQMCLACHKGLHSAAVAGWQASSHARTLWKIEESSETQRLVADFTKSPFPKAQVAWVLGAGIRGQAFLDKDFKVLPGQWISKSKTWKTVDSVNAKTECLACHTTGYNPEAGSWVALNVTCEMCHGPGSVHASSADKKGTIVRPQALDPVKRAMVCGQCHSRGKSKDGKYPFPVGFHAGDDLDQFFTYDQDVPAGAMNAEYNELRFGGGKHLAAGTVCTTCHDPHGEGKGLTTMLREPINQGCQKCHTNLTGPQHAKEALAAVTCAMCHMPGGKHTFTKPPKG